MVDGGEPGVDSKDEGKHTGRNANALTLRNSLFAFSLLQFLLVVSVR